MARLLLSLALLLGIAHAQNPCVADVIAVAKEVAAGVKGIEAAISDCATSNQTVCEKDIDAAADDLAAAVKLATTAVNDCGGSASPNCTKAVNDLAADVKEAADKIADAVVNDCKPPWWQNISTRHRRTPELKARAPASRPPARAALPLFPQHAAFRASPLNPWCLIHIRPRTRVLSSQVQGGGGGGDRRPQEGGRRRQGGAHGVQDVGHPDGRGRLDPTPLSRGSSPHPLHDRLLSGLQKSNGQSPMAWPPPRGARMHRAGISPRA